MKLNLGPAKGKDSRQRLRARGWSPPTSWRARRRPGYDLAMTAAVNGDGLQPAATCPTCYWRFGEMIAYASRGTRVRPGDVIGSGTVGTGCILELVPGARRRGLSLAAWPATGCTSRSRALGAIDAAIVEGARSAHCVTPRARPPRRPRMSAGTHLDEITDPGPPEAAGGRRRHLRLHPARRHLVDQQHRLPRRPAGRGQRRHLLHRAAHPGLPATRSRRSRPRRSARWSTPTTTATTPSATACSRPPRSSATSGPARRCIAFGPPRELPFWDHVDWGDAAARPAVPHLHRRASRVHVGDLRAEVRHVGTPAHTTNDSWSGSRSGRVLFCGDLVFNGGTPFLLMGSVAGAIDVLENVVRTAGRRRPRARARPGVLRTTLRSTPRWTTCASSCDVAERGRDGRGARRWRRPATPTSAGSPTGPTPSASSATCTAPTPSSTGPPRGGPIDVFAALGDMVAYNGGRPLTCLA